jgi:calpain-15
LGDCYFLASISALGNRRPDLLLDIFITRTYNPSGLYGVKLCIDGEFKAIGVDDYIPIQYDKPAFTKGSNDEIWVMIIEKAWAKVFGSYENIVSGFPTEVLRTLTGAPTRTIFTTDDDF